MNPTKQKVFWQFSENKWCQENKRCQGPFRQACESFELGKGAEKSAKLEHTWVATLLMVIGSEATVKCICLTNEG